MTRKSNGRATFAAMLNKCIKARTTASKERKSCAFWKRVAAANGWKLSGYSFEHAALFYDQSGNSTFEIHHQIRDALIKWMDVPSV